MAKPINPDRLDPSWPEELPNGEHPVSELVADMQGPMPPFGDIQVPQATVPYVHPVTEINR